MTIFMDKDRGQNPSTPGKDTSGIEEPYQQTRFPVSNEVNEDTRFSTRALAPILLYSDGTNIPLTKSSIPISGCFNLGFSGPRFHPRTSFSTREGDIGIGSSDGPHFEADQTTPNGLPLIGGGKGNVRFEHTSTTVDQEVLEDVNRALKLKAKRLINRGLLERAPAEQLACTPNLSRNRTLSLTPLPSPASTGIRGRDAAEALYQSNALSPSEPHFSNGLPRQARSTSNHSERRKRVMSMSLLSAARFFRPRSNVASPDDTDHRTATLNQLATSASQATQSRAQTTRKELSERYSALYNSIARHTLPLNPLDIIRWKAVWLGGGTTISNAWSIDANTVESFLGRPTLPAVPLTHPLSPALSLATLSTDSSMISLDQPSSSRVPSAAERSNIPLSFRPTSESHHSSSRNSSKSQSPDGSLHKLLINTFGTNLVGTQLPEYYTRNPTSSSELNYEQSFESQRADSISGNLQSMIDNSSAPTNVANIVLRSLQIPPSSSRLQSFADSNQSRNVKLFSDNQKTVSDSLEVSRISLKNMYQGTHLRRARASTPILAGKAAHHSWGYEVLLEEENYDTRARLLQMNAVHNAQLHQDIHSILSKLHECAEIQDLSSAALGIAIQVFPSHLLRVASDNPLSDVPKPEQWRRLKFAALERQRSIQEARCSTRQLIGTPLANHAERLAVQCDRLTNHLMETTSSSEAVKVLLHQIERVQGDTALKFHATYATTSKDYSEMQNVTWMSEKYVPLRTKLVDTLWKFGGPFLDFVGTNIAAPVVKNYGKRYMWPDVRDFIIIPYFQTDYDGGDPKDFNLEFPRRSILHWVAVLALDISLFVCSKLLCDTSTLVTWISRFSASRVENGMANWLSWMIFRIASLILIGGAISAAVGGFSIIGAVLWWTFWYFNSTSQAAVIKWSVTPFTFAFGIAIYAWWMRWSSPSWG